MILRLCHLPSSFDLPLIESFFGSLGDFFEIADESIPSSRPPVFMRFGLISSFPFCEIEYRFSTNFRLHPTITLELDPRQPIPNQLFVSQIPVTLSTHQLASLFSPHTPFHHVHHSHIPRKSFTHNPPLTQSRLPNLSRLRILQEVSNRIKQRYTTQLLHQVLSLALCRRIFPKSILLSPFSSESHCPNPPSQFSVAFVNHPKFRIESHSAIRPNFSSAPSTPVFATKPTHTPFSSMATCSPTICTI
ncbi:hypothetical protein BLNAU_16075 [Blattamonas nauphoetae]|uniref:Uncharacterized protein n=1 Tax=Blattamonas nauphoetae TaxID=2049346 RepID=A0ABQ9XDM3_9EUKA|nr:hypothetical protein BLNAU_16075 [Blattamonas nauphoetae]